MYHFRTIAIFILWISVRGSATDHGIHADLSRRLTRYEAEVLSELAAASFIDFVAKRNKISEDVFLHALKHRVELQDIDWHDTNVARIANQLESLAKEEADTSWRNKFNACVRTMLKFHGWNSDKMMALQEYMTQSNMKKRRREYRRRMSVTGKSEELKLREAEYRRRSRVLRRDELKKGRGLPLLDYIELPSGSHVSQSNSPKVWHEEASKYRCMYRSCKSFIQALRNMFDKLGYPEEETFSLRKDERNFDFEPWELTPLKQSVKPEDRPYELVKNAEPPTSSHEIASLAAWPQIDASDPVREMDNSDSVILEAVNDTGRILSYSSPQSLPQSRLEHGDPFHSYFQPTDNLLDDLEPFSSKDWDDWSSQ